MPCHVIVVSIFFLALVVLGFLNYSIFLEGFLLASSFELHTQRNRTWLCAILLCLSWVTFLAARQVGDAWVASSVLTDMQAISGGKGVAGCSWGMVVQSDDLGIDIQHFHRPEAWTLGTSGKVVVMATILLRKLWHLPKELRRFSFCIVARSKVLTSIYSGKQLHCWKPVGVGKKKVICSWMVSNSASSTSESSTSLVDRINSSCHLGCCLIRTQNEKLQLSALSLCQAREHLSRAEVCEGLASGGLKTCPS